MAKAAEKPVSKHVAPAVGVTATATEPTCNSCKHWHPIETISRTSEGQCRRYPPTPTDSSLIALPITPPTFCCGEYASKRAY